MNLDDTACPDCGTIGALTIRNIITPYPPSTYAVAGVTTKLAGRDTPQLLCACGWRHTGRYTDGGTHAEFPPPSPRQDTQP